MAEPKGFNDRARGRRPRRPRVDQRKRILDASLELFNERGALAVTTNHIAAHLAVSPGNLYYHFANKEEIIRELWSEIENVSAPSVELPDDGSPPPPEWCAGFFVGAIETAWRFRFFLRDINALLSRDPELAEAFQAEVAWGRKRIHDLFGALMAHELMSGPTRPGDLERLGTSILLLLLNWISFMTSAGNPSLSNQETAEGGLHAFLLLEPHLDALYAKRTRAVLERRLAGTHT